MTVPAIIYPLGPSTAYHYQRSIPPRGRVGIRHVYREQNGQVEYLVSTGALRKLQEATHEHA